jgi:hypothetical protein
MEREALMIQNQKTNKLNRCAFCKYYTGYGCRVTTNSYYCKEAIDEYYQYVRNKGATNQAPIKSCRAWDKK